jgi:hypothetical protein
VCPRHRALAAWLLAAACTSAATDDGGGEGSTGDAEPPPTPALVEPSGDRLPVPIDRTTDIVLGVTGVLPGVTRLLVDDRDRGPLPPGHPLGALDAETLVLRPRGAAIPAVHTIQLLNGGSGDDPLTSKVLHLDFAAVDPLALSATLGEASLPARRLAVHGVGDASVLVVLDDTDPLAPLCHLVPRDDDGWTLADARVLAIPGYRFGPDERGLAIAARRWRDGDATDRLRLAWRVGDPGTAIDLVDVEWARADVSTPAGQALSLDPAVLGPFEHAELDRPALAGDTLVAEVFAATDVEAPRPGDHALLTARLVGRPAVPTGIARMAVTPRQDVDRIGPAFEPARHGATLLSARLDGRRPVVLETDPDHGRLAARPSVIPDGDLTFAAAVGPLAATIGPFGGRTVVALGGGEDGRTLFVRLDDWGDNGFAVPPIGGDPLPPATEATGDPAVAVIAGVMVALVPYGPDVDVHAIVGDAAEPTATRLADLRCDAVALAPDAADATALPLACASGGSLRTGRLQVATR